MRIYQSKSLKREGGLFWMIDQKSLIWAVSADIAFIFTEKKKVRVVHILEEFQIDSQLG